MVFKIHTEYQDKYKPGSFLKAATKALRFAFGVENVSLTVLASSTSFDSASELSRANFCVKFNKIQQLVS